MRSLPLSLIAALLGAAHASAQSPETCRAGTPRDPAAVLGRALDAMGVSAARDRVLHMRVGAASAAAEQSERWYPPYLTAQSMLDKWLDPSTGVVRVSRDEFVWPGSGRNDPTTATLSSATATYLSRDTLMRPVGSVSRAARESDAWLTVADWTADTSARYTGECMYRDRWRAVLTRSTVDGPERLYLDTDRGFPAKVEWNEPHYLWGQVHVENVYSDWIAPRGGTAAYPGSSFRLEDGVTQTTNTVSGPSLAFVPRDSAPRLTLPENAPDMRKPTARAFAGGSETPDTVRVGPQTYLLVTKAYTETVTLQQDTVFLLDATSGEERARADSAWIARLFPGRHPVVVVVTDLAWPHIAGVRFWTARGATIASHGQSRGFLQRVTERHWLAPDALERSKAPRGAQLRFRTVTDSMSLAGGAVRLYEIAGQGSDGALMAYIPGDGYLWASDFVQILRAPSQYAAEVIAAVTRTGVTPQRFAAEHVPLTEWQVLTRANSP